MSESPDKKHTYSVDIKIYEPANIYEVPFAFPENMSNAESIMKLGYHSVIAHCPEKHIEDLQEWASKNQSVLKVIGVTKLD